jgi:hypothetical protein
MLAKAHRRTKQVLGAEPRKPQQQRERHIICSDLAMDLESDPVANGRAGTGRWSKRRQSMIRTRRAALAQSGHRFSLATNAQRLRGDHAQTKRWSEMTIQRKVILL